MPAIGRGAAHVVDRPGRVRYQLAEPLPDRAGQRRRRFPEPQLVQRAAQELLGGRRALIKAQDKADVASDQWHALRVIVKGNSFDVSLDDKPMFKATDSSLMLPGTVGVWSQADSLIRFGSLVVAPVP